METIISCKINNLIRNYCHNFLSYLYMQDGWKRTMFDIGKSNFIPSYIDKNKKNRILISNTGSIILTCNCVLDILESISFIVTEFEKNRLNYIYFDNEVLFKTNYTTTVPLNFTIGKETMTFPHGTIHLSESLATLNYNFYENKDELINEIYRKFVCIEKDESEDVESEDKDESEESEDNESEDIKIKNVENDEDVEDVINIRTEENYNEINKNFSAELCILSVMMWWITAKLIGS